jgi:DNA-binding NarL/FixJ family response regulator
MREESVMNSKPIRVLVVDADPSGRQTIQSQIDDIQEIEILGIEHSQRAALDQIESTQPDLLLVDLMLPGYRSITVISHVSSTYPEIQILALTPGDLPHDRVILAIRAGALGFISRDTRPDDVSEAIRQVNQGEYWLPLEDTYDVLGASAEELAVTAQQRRSRLNQMILSMIPLLGIVAAFTSFLWREYWGQIGVRVVDLGVDPTRHAFDMLVVVMLAIGIFGPLLFVTSWAEAIGKWIERDHPSIAKWVVKARQQRLGRLVFNKWVAKALLALLLLFVLIYLAWILPIIVFIIFGLVVGLILVVNILELDRELPEKLHLPHLGSRRVVFFLVSVIIILLLILGIEVWVQGPDLRTDGLHGVVVQQVLGFYAQPVTLYDLDGSKEPQEMLYLGGNADLYVLYDPCTEIVRFAPVGSSLVEHIDQVTCRSP